MWWLNIKFILFLINFVWLPVYLMNTIVRFTKKYLIFVWRFYFPPASNWYKREESRFYILVNVWKSQLNAMNNTSLTAAISYVFLEIEISSNTTNISSENYILRFLDPYVSNPDLSPWVIWIFINIKENKRCPINDMK